MDLFEGLDISEEKLANYKIKMDALYKKYFRLIGELNVKETMHIKIDNGSFDIGEFASFVNSAEVLYKSVYKFSSSWGVNWLVTRIK